MSAPEETLDVEPL